MIKKRVVFIYRSRMRNGHSIENVFRTIERGLSKTNYEIINYFLEKPLFSAVKELKALNADYYHITGDIYFLAIFLPRDKTTLTLHDIGFYKNHKKTPKLLLKGLLWLSLPLRYVKNFSVISELVKNDIVQFFSIPPKKITVIPNPLTLSLQRSEKPFDASYVRILQIGTGPHKNLIGLIEAVKSKNKIQLDIIGNPSDGLISLMKDYEISYAIYKNINNDEVIKLYSDVDIVYFASLSEGFGLPILEAQASGKPVITSDMSPMKEVAGNGAFLVNPYDSESIRKALETIILNSDLRNEKIEYGIKNIEKYDLSKIVSQYVELFEQSSSINKS